MAKSTCSNPFSFTPMAVTLITAVIYLAIAIPILILHETVPSAPLNPVLYNGLNLSEAWLDLARLTGGYHPYNSRYNDDVRNWLLQKVEGILEDNEVKFLLRDDNNGARTFERHDLNFNTQESSSTVTIFNDMQSNVSFSSLGSIGSAGQGRLPGTSVYFEGTNIMVYIHGEEDEKSEWWNIESVDKPADVLKSHGQGGVLVNAHYDSVSTGYGATDDGVGVVTVLQLIRFFTTPGNKPKKGIVALFNNGEEDFLNGARAYTQHPMSEFAYTFLNLEGAGAGGRAVLFRSTDTEVTKAYAHSTHPFGSVILADGFKAGLIRSGTDYSVFKDNLGLRGLDVAFWHPRARYHTDQDDAKHTNVNSLWHMLSSSVKTVQALSSDTSSTFNGPRNDGQKGLVKNGYASDGVWFDLFGKVFAVFGLRGLFAWSLSLLIASPLILLLVIFLLSRHDKLYLFSSEAKFDGGNEAFCVHGWRGFFRFPIAFVVASAITIGSAYLIRKLNPLIAASSQYAIWSMMLSLWFIVYWFIMKVADFVRPSALHRSYVLLWMFLLGWALLVATTVYEDRYQVASGYVFVFYESAIFLATLVGLLEMFALPKKSDYAKFSAQEQDDRDNIGEMPDSDALLAPDADDIVEEEPTETTPLFGGDGNGESQSTTFAHYARRSIAAISGTDGAGDGYDKSHKPFGFEQGWSGKLPSWTWLIQFLIIGPFILIVIGQVGIFLSTSISQTGPDGVTLLAPYITIAMFTVLLLLPLSPFAHRISYHIPTFLFLVFIGTLIYSLLAFPFSAENRYKAGFFQTVDLDSGINQVSVVGLEDFVRPIVASLPSAAGQDIKCEERLTRTGVVFCSFAGIPPKVVDNVPVGVPPEKGYKDWLKFNVTRPKGTNTAKFVINGTNTRACVLRFSSPIKDFHVLGAGTDDRFSRVSEIGSAEIRLWHREWSTPWTVDVEWAVSQGKQAGDEGIQGKVVCLWSDDNTEGVIPALDEVRRYAPAWSAITKVADGLVEGGKDFIV